VTALLHDVLADCADQAPDSNEVWADIQERTQEPANSHRLRFAVVGAAAAVAAVVAIAVAATPNRHDTTAPGGPSGSPAGTTPSAHSSGSHPSASHPSASPPPSLVAAPPAPSAPVALKLLPAGWRLLHVDAVTNAAYFGPAGTDWRPPLHVVTLDLSLVDVAGPGGESEPLTVSGLHGWLIAPTKAEPQWDVMLLGPPAGRGETLLVGMTVPANVPHEQVLRLAGSIYSPGCPPDRIGCDLPL